MKHIEIDPVLLLSALTVFFALLLVLVDWAFQGEGQVFQVIAGGFTGSLGALLLALKAKAGISAPAPAPPAAGPGGPNA